MKKIFTICIVLYLFCNSFQANAFSGSIINCFQKKIQIALSIQTSLARSTIQIITKNSNILQRVQCQEDESKISCSNDEGGRFHYTLSKNELIVISGLSRQKFKCNKVELNSSETLLQTDNSSLISTNELFMEALNRNSIYTSSAISIRTPSMWGVDRLQVMGSSYHPYEKNDSIQITYNPALIRTKLWTKSSYYLALLHEVGHNLDLNYEFPLSGGNDEALADDFAGRNIWKMIDWIDFESLEVNFFDQETQSACGFILNEIKYKKCLKSIEMAKQIILITNDYTTLPSFTFSSIFKQEYAPKISSFGYPEDQCRFQTLTRGMICQFSGAEVIASGGACEIPQCTRH